MKVKIGNTMYDSDREPIMLLLSNRDKYNIAHMHPEHYIYCSYPENMDEEQVKEWMKNK